MSPAPHPQEERQPNAPKDQREPEGLPNAPHGQTNEQHELLNTVLASGIQELSSATPLNHGRSLPLPLRVKTGAIAEDHFVAETAKDYFTVPWDKVKLVCLGFVEERYDTEATAYATQKLINDMGRMVKGGSPDEGKIVSFKESQILDVCVEGFAEPLRFEANNLNYRAFLGKVSFMSLQNFFRFVRAFASHCQQARFTPNVKHFLAWQRFELRRFPAFHDYNESVSLALANLDKQLVFADLDFSRTSWAQEWSE